MGQSCKLFDDHQEPITHRWCTTADDLETESRGASHKDRQAIYEMQYILITARKLRLKHVLVTVGCNASCR